MSSSVTDYTSILPTGKANAISSGDLMVLMGFESARALQTDIARARNAGQIILSSTTGNYYLQADDSAVQEFVQVLRTIAINTFRAY